MTIHHRGSLDPGHRASAPDVAVTVCEAPGFIIALWRNVSVVVWGVQATMPLVQKLESHSDDFVAKHSEGISAIHVIANGAALPDSTTRSELNRLTAKYSKDLACMATVIEGTGFWASAMHSFITGMHWVSRRPFKVRISGSISDIAGWMPMAHAERTGVRFTAPDLLRAISSVRERIS
ncbi:MAG TPA: hypothetical protein VH062_25030 [Polyangiaceae bacterium]|jgi:hypothetical protein|nr:hypothetical protein [Polyangiaceae bacterium]